jgi:hypothetical protein
MKLQQDDPNFLLPVGTRIITKEQTSFRSLHMLKPAGSYAEIVSSPLNPAQRYLVRFNDGSGARMKRSAFNLYVREKAGRIDEESSTSNNLDRYEKFAIYKCVIGSRAYGLADSESDEDVRGVYLPPASWHWSIFGVPEQIECNVPDLVYWELGKFVKLALKANPNILECLFSPIVMHKIPPFTGILFNKKCFLSKIAYRTYSGYASSQFKKLERDLKVKGKIRWKHAMHLIRLLISGIHLFRTHEIMVDVGEHREKLLGIRNEEVSFDDVSRWNLELQSEFEQAMLETSLPEYPDYEKANELLVGARRAAIEGGWLYSEDVGTK